MLAGQSRRAVFAGGLEANAIADLIGLIDEDQDRFVRSAAARTLGVVGRPAVGAVPALVDATHAEDRALRLQSLRALGDIGHYSPEVGGALVNGLRGGDWEQSKIATDAMISQKR